MSLKKDAGIFNNTKARDSRDLDILAAIYEEFDDEEMIFTTDDGTMYLLEMVIHVNEISSMGDDGEIHYDWDMLHKNYLGQLEDLQDVVDTLQAELEIATGEDELIDVNPEKLKRNFRE